MLVVDGHGSTRAAEDGRFVHVVPHTVDARFHEVLVERAPPVAHL